MAECPGPAQLIPSIELEERRKAYVEPEANYANKIGLCGTFKAKKKKKKIYQVKLPIREYKYTYLNKCSDRSMEV